MTRILVTGGAGFLGSHLCAELISEGHEVLCLDNFYTGTKSNIKSLMVNENFEVLRHDVNIPIYVEVDEVFNLACPASPIHYQSDPIQTTKTSVIGAFNMLGLAKRLNIKILQASTSEVYGNPVQTPQRETYWGNVNPIGLRACYDEGKRCAETLFSDYRRRHGVNTKIARIFNTYGPNMSVGDGRVVSNFIVQALRNQNITVYGDGSQTRSFCYVSDQIRGLRALMDAPKDICGPINIGNPDEITVRTLAETILQMTKSKSKIIFKDLPQDDPTQRCPDISKANEELSWEPRVQLSEGLDRTIRYFQNVMST
ncbi:SDR family oxidoreductase [Alphaproteobacteria bacterium]|nr:SDR family oxidoreductase [Alphaproteobacteria bacterium]